MMYTITRVADRDTPAIQCTNILPLAVLALSYYRALVIVVAVSLAKKRKEKKITKEKRRKKRGSTYEFNGNFEILGNGFCGEVLDWALAVRYLWGELR